MFLMQIKVLFIDYLCLQTCSVSVFGLSFLSFLRSTSACSIFLLEQICIISAEQECDLA
jgi:hypothetical protein